MSSRMAVRFGQAIGGLVAVGLFAAYFAVGELRHMTADAHDHNLALWVYGSDAAPADHLNGRVWLDEDNAKISSVHVYHWTSTDKVEIYGEAYGGDDMHQSGTLDFEFAVPADAAPDANLSLEIEVRSTAGHSRLPYDLHVYRKGTALLRRIGKGVLAVGYLFALTGLFFLLRRFYVRRGKEPSTIYLIPAVVVGLVAFVPLVEQVTRVHRWWFAAFALAAWASAFWLAERVNRRLRLTRYQLKPRADAPVKASEDLENAWVTAGLTVRQSGHDVIITKQPEFAIVSVPKSASFGAEPFVLRASDAGLARIVIQTAEAVIGQLQD